MCLFDFPEDLLTFLLFYGISGPKLVTWRHRSGQILKLLGFKHHNRIPRTKISQNTNFHVFNQISRGIVDIFPILGYFWPLYDLWRHAGMKYWKYVKTILAVEFPVLVCSTCKISSSHLEYFKKYSLFIFYVYSEIV